MLPLPLTGFVLFQIKQGSGPKDETIHSAQNVFVLEAHLWFPQNSPLGFEKKTQLGVPL